MKSHLKYLLYLFLLPTYSQASTLFIGNGGEVLKSQNGVFLRDLVESNSHLEPYFHCTGASFTINTDTLAYLQHLQIDLQLFYNKLCDLDHIVPQLSLIFSEAFQKYSWVFIKENLGLLPEDEQIIPLTQFERIQVANRTLNSIFIQEPTWQQLNPKNKIALVFHEVIFSLLRPECTNTECSQLKQSSRVTRQIIGQLFLKQNFSQPSSIANLKKLLLNSLNISNLEDYSGILQAEKIKISFRQQDLTIASYLKLDSQSRETFYSWVCEEWHSKYSHFKELRIQLTKVELSSFKVEQKPFPSKYGIEYGLEITPYSKITSIPIYGLDSKTIPCPEVLKDSIYQQEKVAH